MDKRTIIFFFALIATAFGVNFVFDHLNKGKLEEWTAQQKGRKTEKIALLKKEIAKQTAHASDLPLIEIFEDKEAKQYLSTGIQAQGAVLALAWDTTLPQKVYAKGHDQKIEEFFLANPSAEKSSPIIYQKDPKATLEFAPVPEFGKYDLQLITPHAQVALPYDIVLGTLTDGHFTLPQEKVAQLENEINQTHTPISQISDSLVLIRSGNGYLPTAIYKESQKKLIPLENFIGLSGILSKASEKKAVPTNQKSEEKYYVIETPYQQFVFTNIGGALAEINLPFKTETNQQSVVREIEFDRDMVERHPYNAHFPAHGFYLPGDTKVPEGQLGGYYPLLRRDLIQSNRGKSVKIPPRYYALNIVSEYPETAELVYEVKSFDKNKIVFETVQSHRRITKTYSVAPELHGVPYCLDLTIQIEGDSRGLWLTSGVPEVEWISGGPAPMLKYRITRNQRADVEKIDLPKDSVMVTSVYPDWICNSNGFFGLILDPLTEIDPGYRAQAVSGTTVPSRLLEIDQKYDRFKADQLPGYLTLLPLKSTGGTMNFRIFAGPFADGILKTVDKAYTNAAAGYDPDYIACQSFHGWFSFISEPFAKFLFILINFFHNLTGNWALSIILLTVALRLMLYPLNAWSTKSMLRMQQIAPEVQAIQEKYKKDPKKAQLEIMNLYRDKGVNPISGCFPLLIQMPFLIGMFDLLKSTFELRGASFIPGWIDNLTAPDVLFEWNTPIFFIGNQFHLLPILTGLVMFLQQRMMSPLPKDPSQLTEQQKQQKMMGTMMAILFAVMFYNFPSGLNIYFLSSMLLGMLQQMWTARKMKPQNNDVKTTKVKEGRQKV